MTFAKTLSRDEMKNVMAGGSGDCSTTNCWMCPTGGFHCTTPSEGSLPDDSCSWGICSECCDPIT